MTDDPITSTIAPEWRMTPTAAARTGELPPGALGTVLVTGGASGLGDAVCRAVAERGGVPVALDVNLATQGDRLAYQVDVRDPQAVAAAVGDAIADAGPLRGVVTAAGVDACGRLEEVDEADWRRVIDVNLIGSAHVVRAALPSLRQTHGRVVTVASTLGLRSLPDATAYCASKYGIVGFTRALAMEAGHEVGVTLVCPGGMDTHFFDGRPEQYQPGPDAQLLDPAAVADAILYALSRPPGVEVREMIITPSQEPSWP